MADDGTSTLAPPAVSRRSRPPVAAWSPLALGRTLPPGRLLVLVAGPVALAAAEALCLPALGQFATGRRWSG